MNIIYCSMKKMRIIKVILIKCVFFKINNIITIINGTRDFIFTKRTINCSKFVKKLKEIFEKRII